MSKHNNTGSGFKGAGTHIKHSIEDLLNVLIATAMLIVDVEAARKHLTELVTAGFGSEFGSAMRKLREQIALAQRILDTLFAEADVVRKRLGETPEWIPASRENQGRSPEDHVETPLWRWQFRHLIGATVLSVLLVLALAASAFTAHANIVGTGLPVFLENPMLPWSMAMLAPMSGLAIKTMISHIRHEGARAVFTVGVMIATVISSAIWLGLFATLYHGLSTDSSFGGLFDEPTILDKFLDTAFVAATLSTEILVGSVLALSLAKIASNYAPNYWVKNPEFDTLTKRLANLEARIATAGEALTSLKGEQVEYEDSLQLQIKIALLAHDGRRAQADTKTL